MNTLHALFVGAVPLLVTRAALVQNGNTMGGYGGAWMPILLDAPHCCAGSALDATQRRPLAATMPLRMSAFARMSSHELGQMLQLAGASLAQRISPQLRVLPPPIRSLS